MKKYGIKVKGTILYFNGCLNGLPYFSFDRNLFTYNEAKLLLQSLDHDSCGCLELEIVECVTL